MEKQLITHKKTLCLLMAFSLSPAPVFAHVKHHSVLTSAMLSHQQDTVPGVFNSDYTTIKNITMGNNQCLTLEPDNQNVMFATCTDNNRQLWSFSSIMTGYLKITNQALAGRDKEYCLGTTASATSTPTMMECTGSGFNSQRAWQIPANTASSAPGIVYRLVNKYRGDLGRNEVLGYSGNRLRMVAASNADAVTWQLSAPDIVSTRPVVGERKVLLIHTHYSDRAAMDLKSVQAAVFGSGSDTSSLASAVAIASYGKLTFKGDTVTDINLGARPATCPAGAAFVTRVRELARQKGIDVAQYDYTFVDKPSTPCSWVGLAALPGNWIISNNAGNRPWMWQHEFGHNLGAPHATSLEGCSVNSNGIVQIDSSCRSTTASDPSDTMNGGGSRLYPAPYALYAGWLTSNQFPLVTRSGDYTLTPLFDKADESHLKAVRILRRDGSYLTLEYRRAATGFESWPANSPFVNGVIVRIATFGQRVTNQLVDTTPGSAGGMTDAPLMPGKSIDDLSSGKRITLLRIDAQGAHVRIQDINEANDEERIVPVAVVPQNFTLVARHTGATIRNLDGSRSTGKDHLWQSLPGNGAFGLQEVASGPVVQEIRQPIARAAFPAGATGTARYQLTVTGSHGTTDSKIVTVTVLPAEVKISGKTSAEKGETLSFSSQANFEADSWRWSLKRGEQTVATSSQATFNLATQQIAAGSYQLYLEASANNQQYLAVASIPLVVTEQEKPEEQIVPVAVVPQNFTIVARHTGATIRNLDGSRSTGKDHLWQSLPGNGAFGLQEVASGPVVQEIRQPIARAAFPAGATGTARYQLTVTGSHGTTDSKIVTVTVLPAEVKISGKTSAEKGETLSFSSQANFEADSWRWSLKRGEQTVATSSQATFNLATQQIAAGSYQLYLEASANNQQYLAVASIPLTVTEQEKPDTPAVPDTPAYPAYVEGTVYKAGDRVSAAGGVYSCKAHPFTAWCAGAAWAYAPGTGQHWNQAWDKVN
ncbi:hypothetical protein [Kalamiella sp. sgz302252]|uniref:hypothetical protein n=1 Tax=Pantoea sp. sgz302252 TaxID=3341827 RepID=UPI0036D2F1C6